MQNTSSEGQLPVLQPAAIIIAHLHSRSLVFGLAIFPLLGLFASCFEVTWSNCQALDNQTVGHWHRRSAATATAHGHCHCSPAQQVSGFLAWGFPLFWDCLHRILGLHE